MKPIVVFVVVVVVVASLTTSADEACQTAAVVAGFAAVAALGLAIADAATGFEMLSSVQLKCFFPLSKLLSVLFYPPILSL